MAKKKKQDPAEAKPVKEKAEKAVPNPEEKGEASPVVVDENVGRTGPIGKDEVAKASEIFDKYQQGKQVLEKRIVENEKWWKIRHWDVVGSKDSNKDDPQPASAWLFNSLANKHADAMDNYPTANILPREAGDVEDADLLSEIIPVLMERNHFRKIYSDNWWYKLKHGTCIYGVYWNNSIDNGVGDIDVKPVDILNIFWEPGIREIQDSANVFVIKLENTEALKTRYPFLESAGGSDVDKITKYTTDDQTDDKDKTAVFDWYYKAKTEDGRDVLHYCKFAGGEVIYATENDPNVADVGFYDHGKYPFIFDTLFPVEGSPCGFGYIDVMKDPQMYIDKMNQIVSKNAMMAGRKRFFLKGGAGINKKQFADWSQDFIDVEGSISDEHIREFQVSSLPSFILNYMQFRVEELKETSGNRDFSQGSTAAGVTAASAIAALQEAGSKLSRDMIGTSYAAYEQINYYVLELIRQFYDEPRFFRVVGEDGMARFESYDNRGIRENLIETDLGVETGFRKPIFDIKVVAQKQSPFNRMAQNELAKELFAMGLFKPEMADQARMVLEMMEFEGKDLLIKQIGQNQMMQQQLMMAQQQLGQLASVVDLQNGTDLTGATAASGMLGPDEEHPPDPGPVNPPKIGRAATLSNQAREKAARAGEPR
jgi:hypothetical protein